MGEFDLTVSEQAQLTECETIIERGLNTFVDVGNALLKIRDSRLYKPAYKSFEDYCRDRWGMGESNAKYLISAARVMGNIGQDLDQLPPPTNAEQVRSLTSLPPEEQREAWKRAVETAPDGKVTGKHVQSVVDEMRGTRPPAPRYVADEFAQDEIEADDEDEDDDDYAVVVTPAPVATDKPEPRLALHFSSETPEHYTPKVIIDAAIDCLGDIDLDPCSNSKTEPNVPAAMHYTQEDDGLRQTWRGRVYMNPPYGRDIYDWVKKLVDEHKAGNATEAIALVPGRIDTQWWALLHDYVACFIEGRLTFIGNDDPAPFPSAVFYLGENIGEFYRAFVGLGDIWQRIEPGMFAE